jgi:hypothetical protein
VPLWEREEVQALLWEGGIENNEIKKFPGVLSPVGVVPVFVRHGGGEN